MEELGKLIDDNGLEYRELEFIWGFFEDEGTEGRKESDELRKLLLEARRRPWRAPRQGRATSRASPCELPKLTERYAELCGRRRRT